MVTLAFIIVTTLIIAMLSFIDVFFYGNTYFEAFNMLMIVSNPTRRSMAVIFLFIGFISCFVIDYRLKKNEE